MYRIARYTQQPLSLIIFFFFSCAAGFTCHWYRQTKSIIISNPITRAQQLFHTSRAYLHYCQLHYQKNDLQTAALFYHKAYNSCQQAIALDKKYKDAYLFLGSLYLVAGNFDKALNTYKELLSYYPGDATAQKAIENIEHQRTG